MTKIDWFTPQFGQSEAERVLEVIKSNYINDGAVTREFENRLAEFLGVRYCVAVTSGTVAIALALMGLSIGPGDEVIVPDLTFIATANAVRLAGAVVKLVDVEPERFTISAAHFAAAITSATKAIVAVDVNGRGADYTALEDICRSRGIALVCDASEALGSKWNGRFLGTFGDAGCFSFSANKTLAMGQGGMIATNSADLYYRLRELKDQGRRSTGTGGDDLHPVLGFNFKLTNVQAAIGLAQFERLQGRLAHAVERDIWYQSLLAGGRGVRLPPMSAYGEVRQWTDLLCDDRAVIENALESKGIGFRRFWLPIHRQKPYLVRDDAFGATIAVSQRGLWLPSSFTLTSDEARIVVETIRAVL